MLIIGSLLWTAVIVLIVYNWRKAGDRNALVLRNVWRNGRIFVAVVPVALIAAGFLAAWQGVQIAQIVYGVICVAGGLTMLMLAREFRAFSTRDAIEANAKAPPPVASPRPAGAQPAETPSAAGTSR